MKLFAVATLSLGMLSVASVVHAQTANSQSDGRDYEALAYLPKDTLVALTYFREVSTSDKQSLSQAQGIFRASYVLKYGNLAIVPFDAILPVVDVTVYATPMLTLHTSGLADFTYLPTIGYVIPENETTHTVIAATAYITGPTGSYDSSRLVNIGDNRWRIQPQIGLSQRFLKIVTFDLVGSLAFYTTNKEFVTTMGYLAMTQNPTLGLEGHLTVDLTKDFYLGASYYMAAMGERDISAPDAMPPLPVTPLPGGAQTVQTVRFTFGIGIEKFTHLLLQYNQDILETGNAPITRFIGARLSHAMFF